MTPRTREHIEGDLKAAVHAVERLQAELATAQPDSINVEGTVYGGRKVGLHRDRGNCVLTLEFDDGYPSKTRRPNVFLCPSEASQIRNWLNYHFPVAA